MKFNKKSIYIGLFGILYLIVAFSSFFHACAFFGLANNSWMSIILAFAFEVGQAAVLFSLLTSTKDRSRIMPWVLMTMFTLVQVIGNVYSSYKYIITNSVENLRYFKEPIFIWTDLPDAQANVIIVYLVGALLPIAALLLTSMITNYLTDQSKELNEPIELDDSLEKEIFTNKQEIENLNVAIDKKDEEIEELKKQLKVHKENPLINEHSILQMENQGLEESNKKKDEEIDNLKKELEQLKNDKIQFGEEKNKPDNDDVKWNAETSRSETTTESIPETIESTIVENNGESNSENNEQEVEKTETELEEDKSNNEINNKKENISSTINTENKINIINNIKTDEKNDSEINNILEKNIPRQNSNLNIGIKSSSSLYKALNVQKSFNFFRNNNIYKSSKDQKTFRNLFNANNKIIKNNSIKVY